ncbi:MAG: hypothetical protein ACPLXL_02265 [Minisyncoccia bacterium]
MRHQILSSDLLEVSLTRKNPKFKAVFSLLCSLSLFFMTITPLSPVAEGSITEVIKKEKESNPQSNTQTEVINLVDNTFLIPAIDKIPDYSHTMIVLVTGYSSTPEETDNDPFITASGKFVRDGIIAANFLPFGTKVRLPLLYPDKIFVVEDRMHSRFSKNRVDIWFPSKEMAITFGVKETIMEIIP